jgi:transcriptional regulator with XRE-family HTH domain
MFDTKKFGAHISRLRKNADMTQSELADKLSVTRQAVSKYEVGDSFPDISILLMIAEVFNTTLDTLISSGEPTKGEAEILEKAARSDIVTEINKVSDIVNLAPLLKPSVLGKMAEGLSRQGIDISNIVALAEYMNDESVMKLLENATFDTISDELLEKLIPFLDENSKNIIFERILEGELDYHLIKAILPFAEYLVPLIENAVVYGTLNENVLKIIRDYFNRKNGYM